jgi:hypothetical protein
MFESLRKTICILALLLSAVSAQANIIHVSFSGTIETNDLDVPVDTIVSAGFSYDTSTTSQFVINSNAFAVFDVYLNMMGESVTNNFGFMKVFSDSLSLQSGPYLSGSGGTAFSNFINGIEIRGIGFTVNGTFTADLLPTDPTNIYGKGGTFFVNRSRGNLYDVNAPNLLKIPESTANDPNAISEPYTSSLFILAIFALVIRNRRNC